MRDLDDGGMGSIEFIADNQERRYACGSKIGVVLFDTDGVDVISAVIIVDQEGFIFELDIIKGDYSELGSLAIDADKLWRSDNEPDNVFRAMRLRVPKTQMA